MKNRYTQKIARARWSKIPKDQRAALVPRNGGRHRIYPPCPSGKPHRFKAGKCKWCEVEQIKTEGTRNELDNISDVC